METESRSIWPLTAASVAAIVAGRVFGAGHAEAHRLCLDTRAGVRPGDLFVGLPGARFRGSRFARQALAEGATIAIADEPPQDALPEGTAWIVVPDPLLALHALAAECRRRFAGVVVAVTGSNGKTIVKDMLLAALGTTANVWASPMSWNSQVGVPAALLQLDPAADVAVVECGISLPGEMERLAAIVDPDLGVFVNVGTAHAEHLGDSTQIARQKALLFAGARCRSVFVPHDQVGAIDALQAVAPHTHIERVVVDSAADAGAASDVWLVDATLARAAALALGGDPQRVDRALAEWAAPAMRLEMTLTPQGVLLINDAYVSDPVSAEAALRVLLRERTHGAAIAVLGGFAQLGARRAAEHARLGARAAELGVDRLVAVGPWAHEIADGARAAGMAPDRIHEPEDAGAAAQILSDVVRPGDRVLLKGSRPARLEGVAEVLFDALAPTRLLIDLDAIRQNFQRIREAVGPDCGVMPVVKAFGYGVDATRLAQTLLSAGAVAIAVAYPDEGLALRERGIAAPIVVQNIVPAAVEKVVRGGLSAVVPEWAAVERLEVEARRQGRRVRVHLKVDTGMGRLGVLPEDAVGLAERIAASDLLVLDGLMTHLAASESAAHDGFTQTQLSRFEAVRCALEERGLRPRLVHAANSSAIARHPAARYSLVRAGIGLLGYADGVGALGPREALRLVTQIVACKQIPEGHSVGYGATWTASGGPRRIAVVALGYADGYPIALSSRGWMLVHGVRCPVVGRICMDVCMLDVTDVPREVSAGDEVVVFGPGPGEPRLSELAREAGTIAYQMLTALSPRIRRIFVGEWPA